MALFVRGRGFGRCVVGGGAGRGGNGEEEEVEGRGRGGALSSTIWEDPPAFEEASLERSDASLPGSRVLGGGGGGWLACPP